MNRFEYTRAESVAQAIGQLGEGVVLKAGGVDLVDRLKEGLLAPRRVVDLSAVPGLDGVHDDERSGLQLGPLVTLATLAAHPTVQKRYAALAAAAGHAATPQIRNMATLGGNLAQRPRCWYFRSADFQCRKKGGDSCFAIAGEHPFHAVAANQRCAAVHASTLATALLALGARLKLTGARGERELGLAEFFVAPETDVTRENVLALDEVITEIHVPAPAVGARSAYHKQGEKESFDWPIGDVAVLLELDGKRCRRAAIALGSFAPVPVRAPAAEALLAGKIVDEAAARAAARAAVAGATPLRHNGYKLPIFETIIRRTLVAAAGGAA